MNIAHEKLHGLDRDRIVAAVEPVLRAHGVEGVELLWRTDRGERVLELTVERPGSRIPGAGITIDVCTEISRDLSAALDVADVIPGHYRLEVGSPGLDRALYRTDDYQRFAGQLAKLKLADPVDGQKVLRGTLHGLAEDGQILIDTERGELGVDFENIRDGRLVFDWKKASGSTGGKAKPGRRRSNGRGNEARAQRSK